MDTFTTKGRLGRAQGTSGPRFVNVREMRKCERLSTTHAIVRRTGRQRKDDHDQQQPFFSPPPPPPMSVLPPPPAGFSRSLRLSTCFARSSKASWMLMFPLADAS